MPALPLIELLPTGQFRLNPEAISFLETVGAPLSVVACAGKYRTGKSSLLNRVLLDVTGDEGFGVGQTVQACTKGLWMHTKIMKVERPDGSGEANVLIIDTEGLGAFNATSSHDSRIFSLALLISSFFIYNSVGTIDEQAISTLSLVANISKLVKTRSTDRDGEAGDEAHEEEEEKSAANTAALSSAKELGELFPDFLWVVRDFSLQLRSENDEPLTADQYLEQALREKPAGGTDISDEQANALSEKNYLRSLLRAYFPRRQCVTMVRPCTNEEDLQRIDTMPRRELRADFRTAANEVRKIVLGKAPLKTVGNGKPLSGRGLAHLCKTYVDAMNRGVAPVIRDSWALLTEVQFRDAAESAEEYFRERLAEAAEEPRDPSIMDKMLKETEAEAFRLFSSEVPDTVGPMYDKFSSGLTKALYRLADEARKQNMQAAGAYARSLLEEHIDNRQFESWQQFVEKALTVASTKFHARIGHSDHAKAVWARFALPRVQAVAQTFGDKFDTVRAESDRFREAALKADEWKQQLETLEAELRETQETLVHREHEWDVKRYELQDALSCAKGEVEALRSDQKEGSSISDDEWQKREQAVRDEANAAVSEAEATAKQTALELERIKKEVEEERDEYVHNYESLKSRTEQSLRVMREENAKEAEALRAEAEECTARAEEAEARAEEVQTTANRQKRKYDEISQRLETCESDLNDARTKNAEEVRALHEKWRQDVRSVHEEKLELIRAAKNAEAQLVLKERELATLREKMAEEQPNVEAERAIAAMERVEKDSQRIRSELFEARRMLGEERTNLRRLERQLRDQEREHDLAIHNLKMHYEVEAARERAQIAATRRGGTGATSTASGPTAVTGQSKKRIKWH